MKTMLRMVRAFSHYTHTFIKWPQEYSLWNKSNAVKFVDMKNSVSITEHETSFGTTEIVLKKLTVDQGASLLANLECSPQQIAITAVKNQKEGKVATAVFQRTTVEKDNKAISNFLETTLEPHPIHWVTRLLEGSKNEAAGLKKLTTTLFQGAIEGNNAENTLKKDGHFVVTPNNTMGF